MKKFILVVLIGLFVFPVVAYSQPAVVEDNAPNIVVKQGFLYGYSDHAIKNLTAIEVAKTRPVDSFGKWNILFDGWSLDAGFAYTGSTLNTAALLLGREFGTLGKYLPIDFPLKDKITITIYPVALRADDLFAHPKFQVASGGGFIKLGIQF